MPVNQVVETFVPSIGAGVELTKDQHYAYAVEIASQIAYALEAGGATLTEKLGFWEGSRGLVVEPVYTVKVFTRLSFAVTEIEIGKIAARIKSELKQESVLVVINDIPYFY